MALRIKMNTNIYTPLFDLTSVYLPGFLALLLAFQFFEFFICLQKCSHCGSHWSLLSEKFLKKYFMQEFEC